MVSVENRHFTALFQSFFHKNSDDSKTAGKSSRVGNNLDTNTRYRLRVHASNKVMKLKKKIMLY